MSCWLIFRPRYLNSTIDQQYAPVSFGTQGGDALFSQHLLQHADPPPHGRRAHPGKVAGRHQQLRLICLQWLGRSSPFRPPHEPPLGKPFLCQPVSLAVIAEQPDRAPAAAPEHEHTPGKRILSEFLLAEPRQRINALASINGFDRHQHPHLGGDLDHLSAFRQARSRLVQSGGAAVFHWIRILLPPEDSNSITHSSSCAWSGAISSTNAGLVAFRRRRGTPPSRFFSPVYSSRSGCATGYTPCCRASSTAACHSDSGSFVRRGWVLRN